MKKETKRAILLAKKYGSIVLWVVIDLLFVVGIYHIVTWVVDKCHENKTQVIGEYLTENLRTIENNNMIDIYNEELKKVVGSYNHVFAQNYGTSLTEIYMRSQEGAVMVTNKDNHFGFINPVTGEVLVEPKFLLAWDSDWESSLAACVNNECKMGFINVETNEVVIPFNIEIDSSYFSPNWGYTYYDFIFRNGYSLVPGKNGLVGIINESGKMVLSAEYSDIKIAGLGSLITNWYDLPISKCTLSGQVIKEKRVFSDYDFCNPIIVERKDSTSVKYGVFDVNKGMIIPVEYDYIDFALVEYDNNLYLCQKDGVIQVFDDNGDMICGRSCYDNLHSDDDICAVLDPEKQMTKYIKYSTLNGWAVMDTDFRVVIMPDDYWEISYLGNGIFACEKDGYSVILKDE